MEPEVIQQDLSCESCGYNLRGLTTHVCPECGSRFYPDAWRTPDIPWLHRRGFGVVRAYWHTAWLIVSGPGAFVTEMQRGRYLDEEEAEQFRWFTICEALLSIVLALGGIGVAIGPADAVPVVIIGLLPVGTGTLIFLFLATEIRLFGVPDDVAPLHDYACAPLAGLPVVTVLIWAAAFLSNEFLMRSALFIAMVLLILWVSIAMAIHRKTTQCSIRRVIRFGFSLIIVWAGLAALTVVFFGTCLSLVFVR